ncbi:MAG: hypothetical protein EZS28_000165 [Streblomastix strix]|uniref:Uncharacterized protein n=1 Tax=Streblomastix strix TaxID=222440 RepID=A0A5J4XB10_9EUKA|nr:MAG: hypothetical protein EZS28_000165 [Streblomastix strix]
MRGHEDALNVAVVPVGSVTVIIVVIIGIMQNQLKEFIIIIVIEFNIINESTIVVIITLEKEGCILVNAVQGEGSGVVCALDEEEGGICIQIDGEQKLCYFYEDDEDEEKLQEKDQQFVCGVLFCM